MSPLTNFRHCETKSFRRLFCDKSWGSFRARQIDREQLWDVLIPLDTGMKKSFFSTECCKKKHWTGNVWSYLPSYWESAKFEEILKHGVLLWWIITIDYVFGCKNDQLFSCIGLHRQSALIIMVSKDSFPLICISFHEKSSLINLTFIDYHPRTCFRFHE